MSRGKQLILAIAAAVFFGTMIGHQTATINIPPCQYEDSNNCYWDAESRGNGQGHSFIVIEGVVIYE